MDAGLLGHVPSWNGPCGTKPSTLKLDPMALGMPGCLLRTDTVGLASSDTPPVGLKAHCPAPEGFTSPIDKGSPAVKRKADLLAWSNHVMIPQHRTYLAQALSSEIRRGFDACWSM